MPVAKRKLELMDTHRRSRILRSAVRDVSWEAGRGVVSEAAVHGTSGVLLCLDERDDPHEISPLLRNFIAGLGNGQKAASSRRSRSPQGIKG